MKPDNVLLAVLTFFVAIAMAFSGCEPVGAAPAAAQELVHRDVTPQIVWDDATRLALGQCDVAEAGWRNHTEHAAMAFVLLRRWREYNERHPDAPITFEQEIRQYCHVHRVERASSSNGWALGLTWGPLEADPREAADPRPMCTGDDCWRRYASRWDAVRAAVLAFEAGELRDPMPLAIIWGGAMDHGGSAPSLVWLGPTVHSIVNEDGGPVLLANRFYGRRSAIARAASRRVP